MLRRACKISGKLHGFSSRFILPLSMRLISKMSLIRLSKWLPEVIIFFRYSCTCSRWLMWVIARLVKPTMAFIGVRMSCDILERKTLLALLARLACWRASCNRFFFSSSLRVSSSTLRIPSTMPWSFSQVLVRTAFSWK